MSTAVHAPAPLDTLDPVVPAPVGPPTDVAEAEATTRQRVLQLVASAGPVATGELAAELGLTAAAIRRHVGVLESRGQIAVHEQHQPRSSGPARRGRPARRYVVTTRGQSALSSTYPELAAQALRFLAEVAGPDAVEAFAASRVRAVEERYAASVDAAGPDVTSRARVLAQALGADGYAASTRPVPGRPTLQLCQGHCPVQQIAAEFPQICEAEAAAFSRLLGVHVQRLSTLASGGHVCTTNIPITTVSTARIPTPTTAIHPTAIHTLEGEMS